MGLADALEENGIFIFQEVDQKQGPPHVESLRAALRDANYSIASQLSIHEKTDINDRKEVNGILGNLPSELRKHARKTIARLQKTKDEAINLDKGNYMEREWVSFFYNNFFSPLKLKITNDDSRRSSREKFYYDYFEYAGERHWTLFTDDFRKENNQTNLTEPRPDQVAYFPIYGVEEGGDGIANTSERWKWAMCPMDDPVRNFSLPTLLGLAEHGLLSSAVDILTKRRGRIARSDFICYPWLIAEHKKGVRSYTRHCYAQAANAAVAALMMYRNLAKYATPKVVPPVVTMTAVGGSVCIWIAYCDDGDDGDDGSKRYSMICIWEGDVTTVMGVIELETILENLHTWAMRTLRPWISHYIDQWIYNVPARPGVGSDEKQSGVVDATNQCHDSSLEHDSDARCEKSVEEDEAELENRLRNIFRGEAQTLIDKMEFLLPSMQGVASPPSKNPGPPPPMESRATQTVVDPSSGDDRWAQTTSKNTDIVPNPSGLPPTPESLPGDHSYLGSYPTTSPSSVEVQEQDGVTEAKEGERNPLETKERDIPRERIQYTVDVRPRIQRSASFTERAASPNYSDTESTTGGAYPAENAEETVGLSEQGESLPAIILDSPREPGNPESPVSLGTPSEAGLSDDQGSDTSGDSEGCFSGTEADDETRNTTFLDSPYGEEPSNNGVSGHGTCSSKLTPSKASRSTGRKGKRLMSFMDRTPESPKEGSHSPIGAGSSPDADVCRILWARDTKKSEASPGTTGSSGTDKTPVSLYNPNSGEERQLGGGMFSFRGTNGVTYIAIPTLSTSDMGDRQVE